MDVNRTATSIIQSSALLNWTRLLSYDRNISEHHIRTHEDHDDHFISLIIVCVGIVMMALMMVLHKCSEEGRLDRCCNLRRENEDDVNTQSQYPVLLVWQHFWHV